MNVKSSRKQWLFLFTAVAVSAAGAGTALATQGSGVVGTVMARAPFADSVDLKFKIDGGRTEVVQVRDARETVMQQITIAPGGHTGWHSHPGPAVVLVKAGEFTLYSSDDPTCAGRTYSAGEAFIDSGQGHVHIGRNLSLAGGVELWVTYFDVPVGQSFRIDAPDPGTCGF